MESTPEEANTRNDLIAGWLGGAGPSLPLLVAALRHTDRTLPVGILVSNP